MDGDRNSVLQSILPPAFTLNGTIEHMAPHCPTGNCWWPELGTLGMCSSVRNITDIARNTPAVLNATRLVAESLYRRTNDSDAWRYIPHNVTHNVLPGYMVITAPLLTPTGVFGQNILDTMHADMVIAYSNTPVDVSRPFNGNMGKFEFIEFALYWCTKKLNVSVSDGVPKTEEVAHKTERLFSLYPKENDLDRKSLNNWWETDFVKCYTPGAPTCQGYGGELVKLAAPSGLPTDQNRAYRIELWTALATSFITQTFLSGGLIQTAGLTPYAIQGEVHFAFGSAIFGDRIDLPPYSPEMQFGNIQRAVENIALGLTNGFRQMAEVGDRHGADLIPGTALTPTIIIRVHWPWVTLIALQVLIMWVALVSVLWRRGKTLVMKGSMTAYLHILERLPLEPGGVCEVGDMERRLGDHRFELVDRVGASGGRTWFLQPAERS